MCPYTVHFCFFFLKSGVLSGFHSFIMHSQDADRWHLRQQTFISLTEEAMSSVTVSYCENHSPRLLMVHQHNSGNLSLLQE